MSELDINLLRRLQAAALDGFTVQLPVPDGDGYAEQKVTEIYVNELLRSATALFDTIQEMEAQYDDAIANELHPEFGSAWGPGGILEVATKEAYERGRNSVHEEIHALRRMGAEGDAADAVRERGRHE